MNITNLCPDKSPEVAHQMVDNEAVLVIPGKRAVNVLNEVGARIWQLSDSKRKTEDIAEVISREFEVTKKEALADILEFINDLVDKKMLILK